MPSSPDDAAERLQLTVTNRHVEVDVERKLTLTPDQCRLEARRLRRAALKAEAQPVNDPDQLIIPGHEHLYGHTTE